uniref:Uncharacterized protein n=1 Tax=Vombatus ursinus TaxID=29139 RepID=A0A4X2LSP4_VOMUR
MMGSLPLPECRGTHRSCKRSRKRKKAKEKKEEPKQIHGSCPSLLPINCVPGTSSNMLTPPSVGLRTDGIPFTLCLQWVPSMHSSTQAALGQIGSGWISI